MIRVATQREIIKEIASGKIAGEFNGEKWSYIKTPENRSLLWLHKSVVDITKRMEAVNH